MNTRKPRFLIIPLIVFLTMNVHAEDEQLSSKELKQLSQLLVQQQAMIAELKANQENQQKEIEALRHQLGSAPRKSSAPKVAAASPARATASVSNVSSAKSPIPSLPAADAPRLPSIKTSPEGVRISVGGHINRAINVANDGDSTKSYFVDSGNVPTFAYIKGFKDVNPDLTIGGHIEFSLQANPASAASQTNPSPGFATSGRYLEMTVDSKRWGKAYFGNGLSSAFFLGDLDKAGMLPYNMLSAGAAFGGLLFVDSSTGDLSNISVGQGFVDLEAFNLISRVRYDLPVWKGFGLSGNIGQNNYAAAALRWNGKLGDFDLTAVSSYQNNPQGGRVDHRLDGGIGVLHRPSGLNFVAAGVDQNYYRDLAGSDPDSNGYSLRLGWRKQLLDIGETKFAVDYQRSRGVTIANDTATTMGLMVAQEIRDWNTEVYAGYRFFSLDRSDNQLEDIHGFTFGARIFFDATLMGNTQ